MEELGKSSKHSAAILSKVASTYLTIGVAEQNLLCHQNDIMWVYYEILEDRIVAFKN